MNAMQLRNMTPEDRFWTQTTPAGECLIWTGTVCSNGYGAIMIDKRKRSAHRYAYELLVGPIPPGLTIDHLCRNPTCVAPTHLEPVTMAENIRRGRSPSAKNLIKTHCKRDHPLSGDNLYLRRGGGRTCVQCELDAHRVRYRRGRLDPAAICDAARKEQP